MTSATTALSITPLLFFGGSVLENFTVGMLFGIVIGTFSSIYVAASLLLYMRPLTPAAGPQDEPEVKAAKSPAR
jgi:preprotein translocase subunit SecF